MGHFQRGVVHHLLLYIIIAVSVGGLILVLLFAKGGLKKAKLPFQKETPQVELKTEYKNPFAKESQYVNPFDQYKSTFLSLR